MKLSLTKCVHSSKPLALLLILMVTMPLSAHATLMNYTYTGPDFTVIWGAPFTTSDHLTISFAFDPTTIPLSATGYTLYSPSSTQFQITLSAGPEALVIPIGDPVNTSINSDVLQIQFDPSGNIFAWELDFGPANSDLPPDPPLTYPVPRFMSNGSNSIEPGRDSAFMTSSGYTGGQTFDTFWRISCSASTATSYPDLNPWSVTPATTAPVPEPATMLLLGTGLLGVAGFRKKLKK